MEKKTRRNKSGETGKSETRRYSNKEKKSYQPTVDRTTKPPKKT